LTRRMIAPLLFGVIGVAILLALGTWQVQRLQWKTAILDQVAERLARDPVDMPQEPDPERDRYRLIRAEGRILPGELHVYIPAPPGASEKVGYRVIVPLELTDGRRILLDRGFIPESQKEAGRHTGAITVEGALDWPRETDSYTSEPDRGKNIWFARDVTLMAQALETDPVMLVTAASDDAAQPWPLPVTVNIRNNHLEYAITWFSLALVWTMMTLYLLWRIRRRTD